MGITLLLKPRQLLLTTFLVASGISSLLLFSTLPIQAQQAPFVSKPFYGELVHQPNGSVHQPFSLQAMVGVPFEADLHIPVYFGSGGSSFTSVSVSTAHLPPGLNFDDSHGAIVAVPEQAGDYSFTVKISGISYSGTSFGDRTTEVRIIATGN